MSAWALLFGWLSAARFDSASEFTDGGAGFARGGREFAGVVGVTPDFVAALKSPQAATYVALHANHAREFTPAAREACARIVDAGIPMLSQTVLLKGINDDADTLADLMRTFVENRIKPYYLHHADMAPGTSHFRTTIEHGQALMRELRRRVSGIALPAYVLDIPGGHAKANLETCDIERTHSGLRVRDDEGAWHDYPG